MKKKRNEFKYFKKWKMLFFGINCLVYITTVLFEGARQIFPAFLVGLMLALIFAHDLITGLILYRARGSK